MAWFTSSELFDALLRCLEREVDVELILLDDAINYMEYAPDFNLFVSAGGKLRVAGPSVGFMHHKFCVIDSKTVITGSYNWTYYAEIRNVENIVITNSAEVVVAYESEFSRLKNILALTSSCQRLTWNEIETRDDIDFRELNYEIRSIGEIKRKPVRRIFETKTEVVRTEIKLKPYSQYDIGVQAYDEKENIILSAFIEKGQLLPYRSNECELYFDSKNSPKFPCLFLYGNPDNKQEQGLIKEVDLMQIAKGTSDENLPVIFSMSLDDNGSLRIDVSCIQSGQRMTISSLNPNLVKYE